MVLALDLHPGHGLGPFSIGMTISKAFEQLEQQAEVYDCSQVKYHDEEPLKFDVVISFPKHGFHLRFDPWSQRLRLIEIFDVERLLMRYSTSMIGGPSTLATFVDIYALFGPTYAGNYDKYKGIYTLFYPGLSFDFSIPSEFAYWCDDIEDDIPLELPNGTTPVTCRVLVYYSSGEHSKNERASVVKACVPPLVGGSLYMEEVRVKLGEELWFTVGGQHITFGSSPQDVLTELGSPSTIHEKQVDQMVIHSASPGFKQQTICGDYFYNYFTRGLDILFDGQTHKVKKFVLHTNYPGHIDFNSYLKCNFSIYGPDAGEVFDHNTKITKSVITPSTRWDKIKEILGDSSRAAIQNHGSVSNPFGSTFVYGYPNLTLEVMKNGYIATVTLFQS